MLKSLKDSGYQLVSKDSHRVSQIIAQRLISYKTDDTVNGLFGKMLLFGIVN